VRRLRRSSLLCSAISFLFLATALPALAQNYPVDPRRPPPPPVAPTPSPSLPSPPSPVVESSAAPSARPAPPPVAVPNTVVIPAGTRIAVVLDTPISTRISKTGQLVTFRSSESLLVAQGLAIPPDTAFTGKVVEARRPGAFGKTGSLRVKVERIQLLNGAGADLTARLDTQDADKHGRISSDSSRAAQLYNLAIYTVQGTLIGAQIGGGKGAAAGAGAGAAVALLIMMAKHGRDVYLEPGTPFLVILDRPLSLPGQAVLAAQQSAGVAAPVAANPPPGEAPAAEGAKAPTNAQASSDVAPSDPASDPGRPKLKHRPKPLP
jgi:hypothetical protein